MNDASLLPEAEYTRTEVNGRLSIRYSCLESPWLIHGTAVFKDPGYESRDSAWRRLVVDFLKSSIGPAPRRIVIPVQVHGSDVIRVDEGSTDNAVETEGPVYAPRSDGLVTSSAGVMIGVNTADCIPLAAVNKGARVVGIAHCGWRGIADGIVENLLNEMDALAGRGSREGTVFLIGASIGACCYEVGPDFLESFSEFEVRECSVKEGRHGAAGRMAFDLKRLVRLRLANAGIDRNSVFTDNTCTSCEKDALCSYRAEGDACGRMYTYLMITT